MQCAAQAIGETIESTFQLLHIKHGLVKFMTAKAIDHDGTVSNSQYLGGAQIKPMQSFC